MTEKIGFIAKDSESMLKAFPQTQMLKGLKKEMLKIRSNSSKICLSLPRKKAPIKALL